MSTSFKNKMFLFVPLGVLDESQMIHLPSLPHSARRTDFKGTFRRHSDNSSPYDIQASEETQTAIYYGNFPAIPSHHKT